MSLFPNEPIAEAGAYLDAYASEVARGLKSVDRAALRKAVELITRAISKGSTIFACGNGGSAAISNHLVCDCVKGIRTNTAIKPKVYSLAANVEILTAIANDIAYEQIFSYQLESLATAGDVLITISSSGNSPNILRALQWARANSLASIALVGFDGGKAKAEAEISLHVEAENYGVIEDVHQSLMHVIAQSLRMSAITDKALIGRTKF